MLRWIPHTSRFRSKFRVKRC